MDGDLGTMLESILSNPVQMEKIANMAQTLMGDPQAGQAPSDSNHRQEKTSEAAGSIFSMLGKAFGGERSKSRSTQLLLAMRPYMRPEKQEKLDRAIKIAEIVHIATYVMKEYGGDFLGGL